MYIQQRPSFNIYDFFVLEDGEPSFCAACRNEVEEGEFVHALNQDWHLECFRFVAFIKL